MEVPQEPGSRHAPAFDGIPDSARSVVEVMARSWAEPALGNDQGDEQPEPVATTASDATSGTRSMPAKLLWLSNAFWQAPCCAAALLQLAYSGREEVVAVLLGRLAVELHWVALGQGAVACCLNGAEVRPDIARPCRGGDHTPAVIVSPELDRSVDHQAHCKAPGACVSGRDRGGCLAFQQPQQPTRDGAGEAPADLALTLALGDAPAGVDHGPLVVALADHDDGVQRPVELPVPAPVETVPDHLAT